MRLRMKLALGCSDGGIFFQLTTSVVVHEEQLMSFKSEKRTLVLTVSSLTRAI